MNNSFSGTARRRLHAKPEFMRNTVSQHRTVNALSNIAGLVLSVLLLSPSLVAARDPLPSWNEGRSKASIIEFVNKVTKHGSPDFVAPEKRIAVFDNDGTLWVEQPVYVQWKFAVDRVKKLAASRPECKEKQPFKAVLDNDMKARADSGGTQSFLVYYGEARR